MQASAQDFQALPMPVRSFTGGGLSHYRVLTGAECKEVDAETAAEALKMSGMETPSRIVREIRGREVLIDISRLVTEKPAEAAAPAAAAEAAPAEAAPAAEAPAAPAA